MKIFGNYVFRGIIFFAVFGASVFCPLFFFMPVAATLSDKILLAVLVLLGAIAEIILFVFSNYKLLISPMKHINETAKKLSNGEYDVRTHIKTADEEVKRLGKITNRIADEFENLEQMRKSFVANASHELRSPLTSMQGFLQAILDGTIAAGDERNQTTQFAYNLYARFVAYGVGQIPAYHVAFRDKRRNQADSGTLRTQSA